MEPKKSRRKEKTGTVINNKMDKGIVVRIDRTTTHHMYRRIIRKSTRVMAHDEKKQAKLGDRVRIQEVRPLSKNKRWCLIEVLK